MDLTVNIGSGQIVKNIANENSIQVLLPNVNLSSID